MVIGGLLQVYNVVSSVMWAADIDLVWVKLDVSFRQFPHLLAPLTYSFGLIAYVVVVNVAFISDYSADVGYLVALACTVVCYAMALHYKVFQMYTEKESRAY